MYDRKQSFKERLELALSLRDIRPKDLALRTGLSESTISQYRSGYSSPKTDKLAMIARALNVNPTWLLGFDCPIEMQLPTRNLSDEERAIINAYNQSSVDTQNAVCAILGVKRANTDTNSLKEA